MVALPVTGIVLGWSARRQGEASALAAIVVNTMLFALLTWMTLVGGLTDAFA